MASQLLEPEEASGRLLGPCPQWGMPSLMKTGRPPDRDDDLTATPAVPNIERTHSTPDVVVGHAWPALLALSRANRDAAAALLLAMQTYGDPSGHAMQSDELHCWYTDAHDAAEVASQTAVALKLLTTSEITGAVGAYDAGLKLGGNIDASITGSRA